MVLAGHCRMMGKPRIERCILHDDRLLAIHDVVAEGFFARYLGG
jgi:hypothetical protein